MMVSTTKELKMHMVLVDSSYKHYHSFVSITFPGDISSLKRLIPTLESQSHNKGQGASPTFSIPFTLLHLFSVYNQPLCVYSTLSPLYVPIAIDIYDSTLDIAITTFPRRVCV